MQTNHCKLNNRGIGQQRIWKESTQTQFIIYIDEEVWRIQIDSKEKKIGKKVILMKIEKLKQEKLPCHQFVSQGKVTENIALNKIYIY